ncbi:hypothetical protein NOR51B_2001 [Luminiphilus syltensis NOR5-1B]|uniref:UmuC domain-containing protein n=1 Tax=Luminiphilus syltensis NOR5-1B TaxID=565045 RepID=B8KRW4_9GAMM|nr:DNA polymerase Y family protein [Luminiphilus syltensis]EED36053.1 hypothetical protein NOR51B_2001 [Luminiphilus syltensis NOR5-1B]
MALWLCLRFTHLPLECLSQDQEQPVVVFDRERVICANDPALERGVRPQQNTATVRSLLNEEQGHLLERDTTAEATMLKQLLAWGYGITPTLMIYRDDCLLLEIGGSLTLFHGLDTLLDLIRQALLQRQVSCAMAIAETQPGAWLLTHAEPTLALDCRRPLNERIGVLPIALIPDFTHQITGFERAGIRYFSELLALPAAALGRRGGEELLRWLDQLTGRREIPPVDHQPPSTFRDALWFGFEVRQQQELHPALKTLLQGFCRFLTHTQLDTQTVDWQLLRMSGDAQTLTVRSSEAHARWETWFELSCLRLDQLTIARDIEGVALAVDHLQPNQPLASDLFNNARNEEPLNNLTDRLRGRLGLRAVTRIAMRDAHLPEHCLYQGTPAPAPMPAINGQAQRPFWLLPEPQPLRLEQGRVHWNGPLELVHGPERIEDNWWANPASRDYFIARGHDGQRLWIYQDRHHQRWFLHGFFH